jgi:inosine/xanthosine triphosphate pyrophosphatase family protein
MMRLIAATRNPAKVQQLAELVAGLVEVLPLPIEAGDGDAPEDGTSVAANAIAKASYWSARGDPDALVVATDGGLVIPALGDRWDPTRTRRFAGEHATGLQRAEALLRLTGGLIGDERAISWQEALAVAANGTLLANWTASDGPGVLADDVDAATIAAGNGFWIPALWRCPEYGGRRLADLTSEERAARRDHWHELGRQLRAFLIDYRRSRS